MIKKERRKQMSAFKIKQEIISFHSSHCRPVTVLYFILHFVFYVSVRNISIFESPAIRYKNKIFNRVMERNVKLWHIY